MQLRPPLQAFGLLASGLGSAFTQPLQVNRETAGNLGYLGLQP